MKIREKSEKSYSTEQIVQKIQQAVPILPEGWDVATVLRELNITEATHYRWWNHYGGLKAEDVKKVKKLEKMNLQLKKLRPKAELKKRSSSSRLRETFRPDKSVAGRVWRHQHVRYQ